MMYNNEKIGGGVKYYSKTEEDGSTLTNDSTMKFSNSSDRISMLLT